LAVGLATGYRTNWQILRTGDSSAATLKAFREKDAWGMLSAKMVRNTVENRKAATPPSTEPESSAGCV
jgi:hypothetical protein